MTEIWHEYVQPAAALAALLPGWLWLLIGIQLAANAALAVVLLRRRRRQRAPESGTARAALPLYERILTLAGVILACGMDADGMWTVFRDRLNMPFPLRVALFAFLPVVMIGLALKARRNYINSEADQPSTGPEGRALWATAAGSAIVASLAATNASAVALRLLAPLVAAWLYHREIVGERAAGHGMSVDQVTSWFTRWLVRHGLKSATTTSLTEDDLARRVSVLARRAYRMHTLKAAGWWRAPWALVAEIRWNWIVQRPTYARLVANPACMQRVRHQLAVLYQATDGTTAKSVEDLEPWRPDPTASEDAAIRRAKRWSPPVQQQLPPTPATPPAGHDKPATRTTGTGTPSQAQLLKAAWRAELAKTGRDLTPKELMERVPGAVNAESVKTELKRIRREARADGLLPASGAGTD